ncbi:ABC-type sugar transport system [Cutibacterium acnes JCM 18909]|nr:ABC-type sugar transport system [Cutibacterium acnes JCM 18909]
MTSDHSDGQPGTYQHSHLRGLFLSVLPLVALFLLLQRYWKTGLTTGGIK